MVQPNTPSKLTPLIWRRLRVRSDSSIATLHELLQIAFDWRDFHLHRFVIRGEEYGLSRMGRTTFRTDGGYVHAKTSSREPKDGSTLERTLKSNDARRKSSVQSIQLALKSLTFVICRSCFPTEFKSRISSFRICACTPEYPPRPSGKPWPAMLSHFPFLGPQRCEA
jgi:hypothetical protein